MIHIIKSICNIWILSKLFFIDIVGLHNSTVKYYKQSLQIDKKKQTDITRLKHAKDPMMNTLSNMQICLIYPIQVLYIVMKIININLKFGEWTWFLIYIWYGIPFCMYMVNLTGCVTVHWKFGTDIYLSILPIVQVYNGLKCILVIRSMNLESTKELTNMGHRGTKIPYYSH